MLKDGSATVDVKVSVFRIRVYPKKEKPEAEQKDVPEAFAGRYQRCGENAVASPEKDCGACSSGDSDSSDESESHSGRTGRAG